MKTIRLASLSVAALLLAGVPGPAPAQATDNGRDARQSNEMMQQMAPMMGMMRDMMRDMDPEAMRGMREMMQQMAPMMGVMRDMDPEAVRRMREVMQEMAPLMGMMRDMGPDALQDMRDAMRHMRSRPGAREEDSEETPGRDGDGNGRGMMDRHMRGPGPMALQWGLGQAQPGAPFGMRPPLAEPLTPERVEEIVDAMLTRGGNSRLAVGSMEETDYGEIIADIETVDGSLVQRLAFDRHTGQMRQVRPDP